MPICALLLACAFCLQPVYISRSAVGLSDSACSRWGINDRWNRCTSDLEMGNEMSGEDGGRDVNVTLIPCPLFVTKNIR